MNQKLPDSNIISDESEQEIKQQKQQETDSSRSEDSRLIRLEKNR